MKNIRIEIRPTDFVFGSTSPIVFSALQPDGDWTKRLQFFERQKYSWDNDGCICYADQESFDAIMDALMPTLPEGLVTLINQLGYMDVGIDGAVHFHSSPRFVQINTGNGMAGNNLTDPWDAMRKFGVLPWKDMPFDETITETQFFMTPTQANYDKAMQFLLALGGKKSIQYHWLCTGTTNTEALDSARPQAPIPVAVSAIVLDWNQVKPPINTLSPDHGVLNYKSDSQGEWVLDHYDPFEKVLQPGFPILYALQGTITPNYVPPIPVPPVVSNPPTPQQFPLILAFFQAALAWLKQVGPLVGKILKAIQNNQKVE